MRVHNNATLLFISDRTLASLIDADNKTPVISTLI